MKKAYIYIIQSVVSGRYYIGVSQNPQKRLEEHNRGKTTATKNKGPWVIKILQLYPNMKEAKQIEYKLKKLKRKDFIEQIIKDGYIKKK